MLEMWSIKRFEDMTGNTHWEYDHYNGKTKVTKDYGSAVSMFTIPFCTKSGNWQKEISVYDEKCINAATLSYLITYKKKLFSCC